MIKELCKVCSQPDCLGPGSPGQRDGKRCIGTLKTECHPRPVEEERLEDIVEYTLECMRNGKAALPFNPRLLLSMIKELRELRRLSLSRENTDNKSEVEILRDLPK